MKRLLGAILLLTLILSLCACSNNTPASDVEPTTEARTPAEENSRETNATETTSTKAEAESETYTTETTEAPTSIATSDKFEFQKNARISETVIYDANDVRITATDLVYESWRFSISLLIENNSSKDLTFLSGTMGYSCNSINGMMISDGYLNCDVKSGKKANDTISFRYDTLMLYGITEIAGIELAFDISDDDYNDIYTGPCPIITDIGAQFTFDPNTFRSTIQSAAAQKALDYTVDFFTEGMLYDQKGVRLLSQTLIYNSSDEPVLLLEFSNTSESIVNIGIANIGINGITLTNGRWTDDTVAPCRTSVLDINLRSITDEAFIEALGINKISTVDFVISLDDENWDELAENVPIEIKIDGRDDSFNKGESVLISSSNVRITSLGIVEDASEYSEDKYALFVIENLSDKRIRVEAEYGSVSVNDFMIGSWNSDVYAKAGGFALLKIEIPESDIKNNKIETISKLDAEISIDDGRYSTIDEFKISINY